MKISVAVWLITLLVASPATGFQQQSPDSLTRYSPENCGLSLQLPGQPQPVPAPVPEQLRAQTTYMNHYLSQGSGTTVILAHLSATKPIPTEDILKGLVKGALVTPKVSDFTYATEKVSDTVTLVKGEFKLSNAPYDLACSINTQKNQSWLVMIVNQQSDKTAQAVRQRVLDSIKFDGSPCPDTK